MNEFDLIEKYFLPLTQGRSESGDLKDDAAILKIPSGHELVVTSDTLNEGTHFLDKEDPAFIAHKSLRVSLSDLAAMGAPAYAYQLCVAFPQKPAEAWLESFSQALLADQKEFDIFCSGGDTTSIKGPLSVSITAFGLAPEGKAVKRSGAEAGDLIVLTGPVGNAFIGLKILQNKIKTEQPDDFIRAYKKPAPRITLAQILQDHAHAAIDISDGLIADLGQVCKASGVGADVALADIYFSPAAAQLIEQGVVSAEDLLTGGDDYELLLAIPPEECEKALRRMNERGLQPQIIGCFTEGAPMPRILDKTGRPLGFTKSGWSHF